MKFAKITDFLFMFIMVSCRWCVGVGMCGVGCVVCGVWCVLCGVCCVLCVVCCVLCVLCCVLCVVCCGVWCVCCVCAVWCVVSGVSVVSVCGAAWHAENHPCVGSKTSPCVRSKRFSVYRQHARMCSTCGRFAGTHGSVLTVHTDTF